MRCVVVMVSTLCVSLSACGGTGVAAPVSVADGASASLRAGETAQALAGQLRFGFERVIADSRCPKGAKCVWAGDAVVRVWWQRGSGPRELRELHTAPGALAGGNPLRSEIRLLRLEPWPVAGRPIAAGDYVATLAPAPEPADPSR